jgi:hypothetical protein
MMVVEKRPEHKVHSHSVHSEYKVDLRVKRTEILFCDVAGDRVRIQVTVHNAGEQRSQPTVMRLESAPMGAFVPWRPLTQLMVPALEPGQSIDLSTEVPRPRPPSLGGFNRVPPKKLLTAVNSPDQPSPPGAGVMAWLDLLRRGQASRSSDKNLARSVSLAPDLCDLLGACQPHWAGNINVFIGSRSVERHLARALRIYPGRTNLAMFVVGTPGRRDAFAFELVGLKPDWKAGLFDVTNCSSIVVDPSSDTPIEDTQWVESNAGLVVVLATHPPAECRAGNLEVHVTRKAGRETAIVEFDLDPAAQGTGCYRV